MTICISSYKTQWRSQKVEAEEWNILSSSPCLGNWSNILGVNWGWSPNRSARDLRSKPESKAKPEIERGRDMGRGLGESLPKKNFENSYLKPCNLVYSSTFQAKIYLFPVVDRGIFRIWTHTTFRSQPNSAIYVFENVVNSPLGSRAKPQLSTSLVHFQRMHFFGVAWIAFFKKYTWYGPNTINQNSEL